MDNRPTTAVIAQVTIQLERLINGVPTPIIGGPAAPARTRPDHLWRTVERTIKAVDGRGGQLREISRDDATGAIRGPAAHAYGTVGRYTVRTWGDQRFAVTVAEAPRPSPQHTCHYPGYAGAGCPACP